MESFPPTPLRNRLLHQPQPDKITLSQAPHLPVCLSTNKHTKQGKLSSSMRLWLHSVLNFGPDAMTNGWRKGSSNAHDHSLTIRPQHSMWLPHKASSHARHSGTAPRPSNVSHCSQCHDLEHRQSTVSRGVTDGGPRAAKTPKPGGTGPKSPHGWQQVTIECQNSRAFPPHQTTNFVQSLVRCLTQERGSGG